MKVILLLISTSFLIISCNKEGRIFEEHKELSPDVEWIRSDSKEFKVTIDEMGKNYDMLIAFRFANGYQFENMTLKITEIGPSGTIVIEDYDLRVRDENGEYIGEAGYDIWDSEHLISANKKYSEVGEYTYILEHTMLKDPLYYAMEVGLIIDIRN